MTMSYLHVQAAQAWKVDKNGIRWQYPFLLAISSGSLGLALGPFSVSIAQNIKINSWNFLNLQFNINLLTISVHQDHKTKVHPHEICLLLRSMLP